MRIYLFQVVAPRFVFITCKRRTIFLIMTLVIRMIDVFAFDGLHKKGKQVLLCS